MSAISGNRRSLALRERTNPGRRCRIQDRHARSKACSVSWGELTHQRNDVRVVVLGVLAADFGLVDNSRCEALDIYGRGECRLGHLPSSGTPRGLPQSRALTQPISVLDSNPDASFSDTRYPKIIPVSFEVALESVSARLGRWRWCRWRVGRNLQEGRRQEKLRQHHETFREPSSKRRPFQSATLASAG